MKTKSTSQTARKLTGNAILFAITALTLTACWPAVALADDCLTVTKWRVGTGSWFDCPNNWDNGCPNSSKAAQINNSGTAQILADAPMAEACSLTLGLNIGDSGTVEVSPPYGDLTVDEGTVVGSAGRGKLTITQGTVTSAIASIGSLAGSSGSVTVDGTSSTWAVSGEADVGGTTTGAGGTGLLTVTNGGTVSAGTSVHVYGSGTLTGNGTVNVNSGSGTATIEGTLTPSSGTLTINGNLTFAGGTLECNVVPASADNVDVSGVASLDGRLSVTMTGTTFSAGTTYTLLRAAGGFDPNHHTFPFVSIKGGSGDCFTSVITYDTSHVYLYLSPCSN